MYFSYLGNVWWRKPDGEQVLLNDLTKFAGFQSKYANTPGFYLTYKVKSGERPEQISNRLYGDGRFAWSIILFNGITDIDEQWPRTDEELDKYISQKYPWQDRADVHHYLDDQGKVADPLALKIVHGLRSKEDAIGTFQLTPVTIGDYEEAQNEAKRTIKLINANHITSVENDLKNIFNGQ